MKKYYCIAAAVLCAMTACTKNELDVPEVNEAIVFQVANYMAQTKADGPVAYSTSNSFGTYAWYDAENGGAQHQAFMENEKVSHNGTNWAPAQTYYWPKTGNVDFISYSPYAASPWITIMNDKTSACPDTTATIIKGSIANCAGTEDYMFSDKALNYNANAGEYKINSTGGVPTLFHHALSKISVDIKANQLTVGTTTWKVTIDSLSFTGINVNGEVSFKLSSYSGTGAQQATWAPVGENNIWTSSNPVDAIKAQSSKTTLTTSFQNTLNSYTVVPQALKGKKLHMEFTVEAKNTSTGKVYSTEKIVKDFDLADDFNSDDYWKINTHTKYQITVCPNDGDKVVLFDPAVVEWDAASPAKQS